MTRPVQLLKNVLVGLRDRNRLDTSHVDDVVLGCVTPVGDQGMDIAKTAALVSGLPETVAGVQLNRFCASGLDAVNLAAPKVRSGFEDLVLAGGVASMSRVCVAVMLWTAIGLPAPIVIVPMRMERVALRVMFM